MDINNINNMKGGWYIGNFEPAAYKTDKFEVCYKHHTKGEKWNTHYHKEGTEINYLVKGKMRMQGKILVEGDIFTMYPYEIADPEFLEDCIVVIVKTPSVPGDKYIIDGKN